MLGNDSTMIAILVEYVLREANSVFIQFESKTKSE